MQVEAHDTAGRTRRPHPVRDPGQGRAAAHRRRLALLGHRPEDIAPHVFLSARQVRTWVTRYNAGGPDGLADATGRGRKPPLDEAARTRMAAASGPGRPRPMGSAPSAGRMSASSSGRSSVWSGRCPRSTTSSTPSGSSPSAPGPATRRRRPRPRRRSKKVPRPGRRGRGRPPRGAGRGLVRGRGPVRPEGDADDGVGREGEPADGPEAGGVREPPRPDRGVPGDRAGRRVGRPGPEHRGGAVVPGPVVGDHPRRDARGAGVGRGRVPLGGQVPDRPG